MYYDTVRVLSIISPYQIHTSIGTVYWDCTSLLAPVYYYVHHTVLLYCCTVVHNNNNNNNNNHNNLLDGGRKDVRFCLVPTFISLTTFSTIIIHLCFLSSLFFLSQVFSLRSTPWHIFNFQDAAMHLIIVGLLVRTSITTVRL